MKVHIRQLETKPKAQRQAAELLLENPSFGPQWRLRAPLLTIAVAQPCLSLRFDERTRSSNLSAVFPTMTESSGSFIPLLSKKPTGVTESGGSS